MLLVAILHAACSNAPVPAGSDVPSATDLGGDANIDAPKPGLDARDADATDATVTRDDGVPDTMDGRCAPEVDSDGDGIPNDRECADGTDPFSPDTDMDGLSDGVERAYPRVCVADDRARQRRPVVTCSSDANCAMGERCRGLDPLMRDSDGDGVIDGDEDPSGDGVIDVSRGESDPRLWDTDGDGVGDGMSGLSICRPAGLARVTQTALPGAPTQAGNDPSWGAARRVMGTAGRSAILLDDAVANVAAIVAAVPGTRDSRGEAARMEGIVTSALGAGVTSVLVGRGLVTHEGNPAVTSSYRVTRATSALALRDAIVTPLTGGAATSRPAYGAAGEFLVDVTTVRRTMGRSAGTNDVIVAVTPRSAYDDPAAAAATRVTDIVNTTAVAESDRGLGYHCQRIISQGPPRVDFVWTVDVSDSMGPQQNNLGDTAAQLFRDLGVAGVDFRVAVLQAQSTPFDLTRPGLRFVHGSSATGAQDLAYTVTAERYRSMTADMLWPYGNEGRLVFNRFEEPIAASVLAFEALLAAPSTAPEDQRLRAGATLAAFFVADEAGGNDDGRFFSNNTARWGRTYADRLRSATDFFRMRSITAFGLVNDQGSDCTGGPADMRRCVILGTGGAYAPIARATPEDVAAAMRRIVAAIIGASSPYRLERQPITSTIKVRLRGVEVPRSRAEGFDYDQAANAVVFFGPMHRPRMGDEVVISYRIWQPCPELGGACTATGECCAPQECVLGRCAPPCERIGAACMRDADCCAPNRCAGGRCAPPTTCRPAGGSCTVNAECCAPTTCAMGRCAEPVPCRTTSMACAADTECCSGVCTMGRCAPPPCRPIHGMCTSPLDCCSDSCSNGLCAPG